MPSSAQPTVTQLTANGRGAVAALCCKGNVSVFDELPLFIAANGRPVSQQPLNRIVFGFWGQHDPEEIVICRTDENTTEIHCHGGEVAVRRIQNDLSDHGVKVADAQRGTEREPSANVESTDDPFTSALVSAKTLRTALILQRQRAGLFDNEINRLSKIDDVQRLVRELDDLLQWSEFGLHLTNPWQIVVVGQPNVGKSSLINRLVGFERSIVFNEPGTTRDIVSVETAIQGWPVELSDTAGIRTSLNPLEAEGVQRAKSKLVTSDLQILLLDVSHPDNKADDELLSQLPDAIVVAHKCDRPSVRKFLPQAAYEVSSKTQDGLKQLMDEIVNRIVPTVPPIHQPLPATIHQVKSLRAARSLAATNLVQARNAIAQCRRGTS